MGTAVADHLGPESKASLMQAQMNHTGLYGGREHLGHHICVILVNLTPDHSERTTEIPHFTNI